MFEIGKLVRLKLGYVGEGNTRTIQIDVTEWIERFPDATIVVQVLRPDRKKYLAAIDIEDGILTWVIDHSEVEVPGSGVAQIAAINLDTGAEYRSRTVETIIRESLQEFLDDELAETDPMNAWVNQVVAEAVSAKKSSNAAEEAARRAAAYADKAEDYKDTAVDSASAAGKSEDNASDSADAAAESEKAAATSAASAAQSADRAEMAAGNLGWFDVEVDESGHLIYTRTDNVDAVDFEMDEGRLIVNYG